MFYLTFKETLGKVSVPLKTLGLATLINGAFSLLDDGNMNQQSTAEVSFGLYQTS